MTQCTIDGHKDCKWSNYFYEMQHYGYINFCKNLVYLYDILKRCQNKGNLDTQQIYLGHAAVWFIMLVCFYYSVLWAGGVDAGSKGINCDLCCYRCLFL